MDGATKIRQAAYNLISESGKSAANSLFPNDFEYYMVALELAVDGVTIDYFTFPVMPSKINKSENFRTNVKTTQSGVSVIKNDSFAPHDLTISGDFGRTWKFVNRTTNRTAWKSGVHYSGVRKWEDIKNSSDKFGSQGVSLSVKDFSVSYKSGYGCIKILQSILDKSRGYDFKGANKSEFELYFYNMSLGESYIVVPQPKGLVLSQDSKSSNMMWQYSLNLKVVAPLNNLALKSAKDLKKLGVSLSQNQMQKNISSVSKTVKSFINNSNE